MDKESQAQDHSTNNATPQSTLRRTMQIFAVSAKLGLTSFGGPVAHLGYFHGEYVKKRKWLDERSYAELVALCQFLPGPASSQVGMGIGLSRGGLAGAIAAWIGFTMPSVIFLVVFGLLMHGMDVSNAAWLHGLKLTAVAIVAQAIWSMGTKLAAGRSRATIAVLATAATLLWQNAFSQILIIATAGIVGLWLFRESSPHDEIQPPSKSESSFSIHISRKWGLFCLSLFFGLLALLPVLSRLWPTSGMQLFDSFYRAGSLVFGGGHVVLPLLQSEVVPNGWVSESDFLAGYGATQAVPGPLFTFASYLGTVMSGIPGACIATIAIFLPAFLLIVGFLPFWNVLRQHSKVQSALQGINAAVVGILLAALYNPIWTSSVHDASDFILALVLFAILVYWKLPLWTAVIAGAAGGLLLGMIG